MDEPPTIQEVERMILTLYEPVPPETIAQVQVALHRLQRTAWGWALARDLLTRSDEKVRFFGALTLAEKLNTDSSSLGPANQDELLSGLLGWIVASASENPFGLVTRKLSTALVAFFLRFPQHSNGWIRRLTYSLHWRQCVQGSEAAELLTVLQTMDARMMQVAVLFATDLIEEAGKLDMNTAENFGVYESMRQFLPDVSILTDSGLRRLDVNGESDALRQASVRCLQAWTLFSNRAFSMGDSIMDSLRSLIPTVLNGLTTSEGTFVASMELFTELLSSHQSLLLPSHVDALLRLCESDISTELHRRIVEGNFSFECLQYGFFLLSLGESRMKTLLTAQDGPSRRLLELLCGLIGAQGCPVVEDTIFVQAVEFWSSFSESLSDERSLEEERWAHEMATAASFATRAAEKACQKIMFPPEDEVSQWDSTEREGFLEARKDVADLIQAVYSFSGPSLATTFARQVPRTLANKSWAEAEAAAFCLGSLAECISGDEACGSAVSGVFTSDLLDYFARRDSNIPPRTRHAFISLLERFASYFERNTANLPAALNLLFSALGDHALSGPSSKSIQRLCSSCRAALVPEVTTFLTQYRALFSNAQIDCLVVERVVGGIACVVQAMESEDDRLVATSQLLDILSADICQRLDAAAHSMPATGLVNIARCGPRCLTGIAPEEIPVHACLTVLRCLLGLAKGLRAESDAPVDLDSTSSSGPSLVTGLPALAALNSRIMAVLAKLQGAFLTSGEVVEAVCSVIRAGFTEATPGPFVFSSTTVTEYLVNKPFSARRIGAVVGMACSFVNSQTAKHPNVKAQLAAVLVWVVGLLVELGDPELAQNGIDFVCRLLLRDATLVMELEPKTLLSSFFSFTIHVLDSREPLPKAAAAEFWATFVSCKPPNDAHGMVPQAMAELGPAVTQSLIRNIGGNASRSELDKLSDPIKKMAAQQVMAASWIEAGLFHTTFPSQNISDQDKRAFARKVISLRGARQTNQVIREFWLSSRGAKFAYAS